MKKTTRILHWLLCVLLIPVAPTPLWAGPSHGAPAAAVPCQKDLGFDAWLEGVLNEARRAGVSERSLEAARPFLRYDGAILKRDRAQGVFQQSFLKFAGRMAADYRIQGGRRMIKTHRALFDRIERDYGVPAEVLVTYWGLETDFSAHLGSYPTLTAVTTLAYDCRRAPMFRNEMLDALRLVQRGDLQPDEMRGDWAGEMGGLMISPSHAYHYSVDYDGDGRRDLVRSVADTMATGANLLVGLGWRRGEPWLQEVRVPASMPWEEADLSILHPRSQWVNWGVSAANGRLPADNLNASLLLPMGHLGPAFLAYPNFRAFIGWNAALVYSITAAYLSTRIAGQPAISPGNGTVIPLDTNQVIELQRLLNKHGFSNGPTDGKIGAGTRKAIKQAQLRVGLPADSYPTEELIERLRAL